MTFDSIDASLTAFIKQVFEDEIRGTLGDNAVKAVDAVQDLDYEIKNLTDRVKELQGFHSDVRTLNQAFLEMNDRMAKISERLDTLNANSIKPEQFKREVIQEIATKIVSNMMSGLK